MTIAHETLPITDAALGRVLAEAVLGDQGQVLLGASTTLTADLIKSLSRRGVTTLCVQSQSAGDGPDPQVQRELAAQRIAYLFRHCTQQGTINPLMRLVLNYREGATP